MIQQHYTRTVKEALEAGRWNLLYVPVGLLLLGGLVAANSVLTGVFSGLWSDEGAFEPPNVLWLFGTTLASVVAGVVWRALHIVDWKIESLETVRDIHRLYRLAQFRGMIYKSGFWSRTLQIASPEKKQLLADLETRLDQPRQWDLTDDLTVPDEVSFKHSFVSMAVVVGVLLVLGVVFHFVNEGENSWVFGIAILGVLGVFAFNWLRTSGQPPLRLDAEGIHHPSRPTVPWNAVSDIYLERRQQGKSQTSYLIVATNDGSTREWNLSGLGGKVIDIEHACYTLWVRWRKSSGLKA